MDGKNTTHATSTVVYQQKVFGPDPSPVHHTDHSIKWQSLQSPSSVYEIQECSAQGRRPAPSVYTDQVDTNWYNAGKDYFIQASKSDNVWRFLRAHPSSFQQALEPADIQNVPGWSGFNAILFPEMPRESNIDYCPMIDGSSTEYSTIYTVLKHGQAISSTPGQRDTVITFDLLIYMKAKQIQWRYPR